ncbi:hypothetical protein LGH70_11830 [Hymenobacter sp. BT635]|uniref:S1 motif domain-containing protein n=1 Tax=Hymenobacter nitidus TaxID=2880929 RepID=A0ABS8ACZ9_9BACT|nr:hypothetical protein [Hymenobacter nitidus]MCB2378278.1 hypothetical protein [Hymenobacter nitidus]
MTWETVDDSPFAVNPFPTREAQVAAWEQLKQQLPIGSILTGRVITRTQYGVFYDAGLVFPVLIEVYDLGTGRMTFPDDYPALNSIISGRLVWFRDFEHQLQVSSIPTTPEAASNAIV